MDSFSISELAQYSGIKVPYHPDMGKALRRLKTQSLIG